MDLNDNEDINNDMEFYLKSCPDCGGVVSINSFSNCKTWVIQCNNHNCTTKPRLMGYDIEQVTKQWNDRDKPI